MRKKQMSSITNFAWVLLWIYSVNEYNVVTFFLQKLTTGYVNITIVCSLENDTDKRNAIVIRIYGDKGDVHESHDLEFIKMQVGSWCTPAHEAISFTIGGGGRPGGLHSRLYTMQGKFMQQFSTYSTMGTEETT